MGVPVLVMGYSGSGKSYSLHDFNPGEIGIFSVAGKRLPFKTALKSANMEVIQAKAIAAEKQYNPYVFIRATMLQSPLRAFAIDDSQYLMSFEEMDSSLKGYDKFNSIGFNFVGLVRFIRSSLPEDVIVYFLHHPEQTDDGRVKPKTIGKLIDNHYTLEGLFEITIMAAYKDNAYVFLTTTDGFTPFKNPPGMLQDPMENDLKAVDTAIRDYWGMAPLVDEPEEVDDAQEQA